MQKVVVIISKRNVSGEKTPDLRANLLVDARLVGHQDFYSSDVSKRKMSIENYVNKFVYSYEDQLIVVDPDF